MTQDQLDRLNAIAEPWPKTPSVPPLVHGWTVWIEQFKRLLAGRESPLIVEVGAWLGQSSLHFLTAFPGSRLIAVDPWKNHGIKHERAATCFETWQTNLRELKDRAWAIRKRSEHGMIELAKIGLQPDLVYIDGAHDFGQVYLDMAVAIACFPNSVICGDDYTHGGKNEEMRVGAAVDTYCKRTGRTVTTEGRFWLLNK